METTELTVDRLANLSTGESGVITKVLGHGAFRKRITEMGFVKGKKVRVIKNAPLQDPVEYEIMGYNVSLRRSEANLIDVLSGAEADSQKLNGFNGIISDNVLKKTAHEKSKTINMALVGNPNCGKTSFFNQASGSHERVGNYGGVTIDAKMARMRQDGYLINITDLPGTYSITEYTPEELYVRSHIMERMPDVVVNVVDASNLERNLFLTTQLIDMNIKVVIALNMYDELEKKGARLKFRELGEMLGIPIIPTVAVKGQGIKNLMRKVIDVYEDRDPVVRYVNINYGHDIEKSIDILRKELDKDEHLIDKYSSRYLAVKLLENDRTTRSMLKKRDNFARINELTDREIAKLEKAFGESSETVITDAKYGFVAGALSETYIESREKRRQRSKEIDSFITNRILGFPIFIFVMWLMFQATFTLGNYPMEWINTGVGYIGDFVGSHMAAGPLKDLLVDGVIGGVGGVIVFLPNILILFFFISFMEDTGYMARVSFIMDRLMHKIGLHGKSFIPLIMGFGCNVPAVMATRTLENRKDRILTMMITPFMSCSARLPVYVLIISAFFPKNQGLVLFSIYMIGIIMAIVVALVLKNTVFRKAAVPFVMELPPYRMPTLRNTSIHMWHKGVQYLKKMGGVILVASILIWALSYFPRKVNYTQNYDASIAQVENNASLNETQKQHQISQLEMDKASEHQENSYIGRMGHALAPVLKPLGFDWKIGVSILTGLAAKEIVVSTMGILYHAKGDGDSGTLVQKLQQQRHSSGKLKGERVFTPLVAFGFMLFILIYFPCVAVIAAIKKESNWKWAVFSMVYTTGIAWVVAFATYQIGSLFV
ncbi:ferrous iron transport protein B [Prolixibacter bellariivorans]|uniref:Ferrous iron transport protein B n=2 Tax=Prolixibacter bellariivorans TaxID=314319 RepID=A0A5M4AXM2_9BACT|nr:ferrous iron transport protein B [Prolixibacter bellariivorans]GET32361.1 ferrous iron transport protein B [Prolixibacter bellariivorans]